ncbi:hypothetical protein GR11A_00122 [Vibrio phage vB_VcorM_GR11A]|nr:hypothetical protein GR11A_00122 [Vibrio phage vB_VcorM_GR11A]
MLFSAPEILRPQKLMDVPVKGTVVFNQDPLRLGRIKCTVPPFLVGSPDDLPWVICKNPTGLGGNPNNSSFHVPIIGSEVCIEFPWGVYMPVYSGFWQSMTTHQTLFDEDYPNTYGWRDGNGNYWKINKTVGYTRFEHESGSYIQFDRNGDVRQHTARNFTETIDGDRSLTIGGNDTVNITGNHSETVGGNDTVTVSGTKDDTVTGDYTMIGANIHLNP